jgi:hypothetical protein
MTIPALAFIIVVALFVGLAILLRQGTHEHAKSQSELDRIRALSTSDAEGLARRLLARPEIFDVTVSRKPCEVDGLPSSVFTLLSEYDEVAAGEFWIGRHALSEQARRNGYIKLGGDAEFTEVLAAKGDSRVFVEYGEQPPDEEPEVQESVWHLLVATAWVHGKLDMNEVGRSA